MSVKILRDYQLECVRAHHEYFRWAKGNPLFVIPTGGGKSLVIAEFLKGALAAFPSTRALMLTHVKELIEQNHDELVEQWGGALCPVGIYSASVGRRELNDSITFAGVQSIYKRAEEIGHVDLVMIDEAHMVPKQGQGMYLTLLEGLLEINPKLKVLGYTATHFRLSGGFLHKGKGRMFTDVAYEVPLEKLIEDGHLAPLVAIRPEHTIDTSGVASASTGDFKVGELEHAAMDENRVAPAVDEAVSVGRADNRKSWLFFATGLAHAKSIVTELESHNVEARAIFGTTNRAERAQVVDDFKSGRLQALVNVGVLTTGFNAPRCDMLVVMRPTQSAALYVQIMGRGMRTFPGKINCLVLDYGLNVERHGPINRVQPKLTGAGSSEPGDALMKACPECSIYSMLASAACNHCGYQWPENEVHAAIEREASRLSPIDFSPETPDVYKVSMVMFRRHQKDGRPDSLRVDFVLGMKTVSEWVCLEHAGYARRKAGTWWLKHARPPVPGSVSEAIERSLEVRKPFAAGVVMEGDFERISATYETEADVPEFAAHLLVEPKEIPF